MPKIVNEKVEAIFNAWNTYAPFKHSVCTRPMQGIIVNVLRDYQDVDIIINAIKKYGEVCSNPGLYWWTASGYMLESWMKNVLTRFVDTPIEGFRKKKSTEGSEHNIPQETI